MLTQDFQDLAERSYQRQIAQLKPDVASYAKEKEKEAQRSEERPHGTVAKRDDGTLVPAGEADVPHAVATYGTHKPDDSAVDRLLSHLNHEYVCAIALLTHPDRTRSVAAAAGAKTTPTPRSRTSTSATSTSTARSSAYVVAGPTLTQQYFGEKTQEIRDNRTCAQIPTDPSRARHGVCRAQRVTNAQPIIALVL